MTDTLIDRLREAEGGSRELDADIWEATGHCAHRETEYYRVQSDTGFTCKACGIDMYGVSIPALSSSLDAALALVAEKLPGWSVNLEMDFDREVIDPETDLDPCACSLFKHEDGHMTHVMEWAKSPALAMVVTLLKAKDGEAGT